MFIGWGCHPYHGGFLPPMEQTFPMCFLDAWCFRSLRMHCSNPATSVGFRCFTQPNQTLARHVLPFCAPCRTHGIVPYQPANIKDPASGLVQVEKGKTKAKTIARGLGLKVGTPPAPPIPPQPVTPTAIARSFVLPTISRPMVVSCHHRSLAVCALSLPCFFVWLHHETPLLLCGGVCFCLFCLVVGAMPCHPSGRGAFQGGR